MQVVTSVADILDKSQRYASVAYQDESPLYIRKCHSIPMKKRKSGIQIHISCRESRFFEHQRKRQIGIRNK